MRRRPPLTPTLAIVALLTAAPSAVASTADQEARPASVRFPLSANHGLRAYLEADDDGTKLEIHRGGRFVTYQLANEATEAGLTARFGKLGLIDVAFQPTKLLRTIEPPDGCTGEPVTYSEGIFSGAIEFTGERRYVRISQTRAKGRMHVGPASRWNCPARPKQLSHRPLALASAGGKRKEAGEATAALFASSKRCQCYFAANAILNRDGRDSIYFVGAKFEQREGMQIIRATGKGAGRRAFVFDHAAGVASVRPPTPFAGRATYRRRSQGRDLWRSSIRVPLLGAKPLRLHGRRFRAALVREVATR